MKKYAIALILVFILSPVRTEAQIIITEIMYNLEGADSGFEWIEIYNTGSENLNMEGWKLFEDDTNHRIVPFPEGGGFVLPAGEFALIVDNPEKFNSNNNFSGILFDSSFSLHNSGESLVLRDSELNDVDIVFYDPEIGANGDGNSLQLVNGSWISAMPTLGKVNNNSGVDNSSDSFHDSSQISTDRETDLMFQNILVDAGEDREVIVGADNLFKAFALGRQNNPLENARYIWSMGDGSRREGESVLYSYKYPGEYVVFLSVTSSDYSATDRVLIKALPADVVISNVGDDFIELQNNSEHELNLSWWSLKSGEVEFNIPKDTIILPNKKIKFSSSVTGLITAISKNVELLYPNKERVTFYDPSSLLSAKSQKVVEKTKKINKVEDNISTKAVLQQDKSNQNLDETARQAQDFMAITAKKEIDQNKLLNKWTLSLVGLVVVSATGVLFSRRQFLTETISKTESTDEDLSAKDFKIIE